MATNMKKVESTDGICLTKPEQDTENIFTSALVVPMLLVVVYVYFLTLMADSLETQSKESGDIDPFKTVWWSGPACFSLAYLLMVKFGVDYMKTRKEFQIKPYIFTYNLYQCVLNIWCVGAMIYEVYSNPHFTAPWGNSPQKFPGGFRIAFLVWVHYNNKFVELLDTVWMVLRKKNNQISFLHCYHHVLLIWSWFFVCRFEAGGDCYFGATVNSFIHIIMYGYYTLALLNVPCPWKKWITNCQMLQFMLVLCHSIYVVYKGNMPIELPLVQAFVMVNMLVLFGQFYVKSYMTKKSKKTE